MNNLKTKWHRTNLRHTFVLYRLFTICPDALPIFSFGKDTVLGDKFLKSPRFRAHAKALLRTFSGTGKVYQHDSIHCCTARSGSHHLSLLLTVDMLGPNLEAMQETLVELGRKHRRYGVKGEYFEYMGIALLETVQELLGKAFAAEQKTAWEECWKVIVHSMLQGLED